MSKTMKYTQYLYEGSAEMELEVSDDAIVYLVGIELGTKGFRMHALVRTSEKTKADRCFLIGNHWFTFLRRISLPDCGLPCKPVTECEPPTDCYIVFLQKRLFNWQETSCILENCKDENGETDWEKLKEFRMSIEGISKIRRFTDRGIEVIHLQVKDITGDDRISVELHTWEYDYTWGGVQPCNSCNFFTTEEKYKQLFNDKLEEYYKLFKE